MKKTCPVLLGLLLMAAPATVQAQLQYTVNADNTVTITNYIGPPWTLTIPTNINGRTVTSIGDWAFEANTSLTSIAIAGSVTSIGAGAFFDCTGLTSVTIPGSVTNIGEEAFGVCVLLTSIAIPGGVANIGDDEFYSCYDLTNVTIATGVTSVGQGSFIHCTSLARLTIPGSVTNIGTNAFAYCFSLTSVYFQGSPPTYGVGSAVFAGDSSNPTIYYLPGTSGWFSPFCGLPAVLWNPVIQTGGAGLGVRSNQFGFNITGTAGIPVAVEACTNLASPVWTRLQTITLPGSFDFSDSQWTNYSRRFYRIISP
jgi:hypothetical protein